MKRIILSLLILLTIVGHINAQLTVALYPSLPRADQFKQTLSTAWDKLNTGITLKFVDYDCYSSDPPDTLNVFVFDAIYLQSFIAKGYLTTIDTTTIGNYNNFWPFSRQAVIVKNAAYGVPYLACADVYFYRKSDKSLNTGTDLDLGSFQKIIGKALYKDTIPPINQGLLMNLMGKTTDACYYLSGWMNVTNNFTSNPPLPPYTGLAQYVVDRLGAYTYMAGKAQVSYKDPDTTRIKWFATGHGRSMIGITENSASLPHTLLDSIGFRLMPFTETTPKRRNFYVDVAGINTKTPIALQPLATKLIALMTSNQVMYDSMVPQKEKQNPQFLIPVSAKVLNSLIPLHPLYQNIYDIITQNKPFPFRIGADSREWLTANKEGIRDILINYRTDGQVAKLSIKKSINNPAKRKDGMGRTKKTKTKAQ